MNTSTCCTPSGCSTTTETIDEICSACGVKGERIDTITLKALLTSECLRRGIPPAPRYCANAECEVVYFDNDAGALFREGDLIVPVHAKHPEDDAVPVCYCFAHSGKSIRDEIAQTGSSTATAAITAEIRAGRCACEVRNPKGSCCLGDVARVERRSASMLTSTPSQTPDL